MRGLRDEVEVQIEMMLNVSKRREGVEGEGREEMEDSSATKGGLFFTELFRV